MSILPIRLLFPTELKRQYVGVNRDFISTVPVLSSRFFKCWYVPRPIKLLSLAESRNRILYSPLRHLSSDGIGHAFATMNAEVGAALRLNLSYSHRMSHYGSLVKNDIFAIENFFGWNRGHIPRQFIRETFCKSSFTGHGMQCQTCDDVHPNNTKPNLIFARVVDIPGNLTYKRLLCRGYDIHACLKPVKRFTAIHNKPNTIFQMDPNYCGSAPADSTIDPETKSYFFHRYWNNHGTNTINPLLDMNREKTYPKIRYMDNCLTIAVHARRGDFFYVNRPMVSIEIFGNVIRQAMEVIKGHGGIFKHMPICIHIYSEGRKVNEKLNTGHDSDYMTKDFFDSDGVIRDTNWIHNKISGEHPSQRDIFSNGLNITLHVSDNTLLALHEMIRADIFIGSASGLGKHIVSTLSRGGLLIMPDHAIIRTLECCTVTFWESSGQITDMKAAKEYWGAYADVHEGNMRRVLLHGRIFG